MKFLKSLPKKKLQMVVLTVIGSLIALGVVCDMFVGKELDNISEQKERIEKLGKEFEETDARVKADAINEGLREQLKAFVEEQQSLMVNGDPYRWVVRELNLLAEKYHVKDLGLSPQGKASGAGHSHFDLYVTQINFLGSYDDVGRFVKDLENKFPLSQIRSLSVTPGGSDAAHSCRAQLELALAVRPPDTAKKPAKGDAGKTAKKSEVKKT